MNTFNDDAACRRGASHACSPRATLPRKMPARLFTVLSLLYRYSYTEARASMRAFFVYYASILFAVTLSLATLMRRCFIAAAIVAMPLFACHAMPRQPCSPIYAAIFAILPPPSRRYADYHADDAVYQRHERLRSEIMLRYFVTPSMIVTRY